jgi:hypothetical protein
MWTPSAESYSWKSIESALLDIDVTLQVTDRRPWRAVYAPLAVSANSERLDQLEEGNAAGGPAGEVEAIRRRAVSPSMTSRRFPPPWHADPMPGGYVVRDANGQALAYLYSRDNEAEARQAKLLSKDEARRIAANIARLPELLGKADRD